MKPRVLSLLGVLHVLVTTLLLGCSGPFAVEDEAADSLDIGALVGSLPGTGVGDWSPAWSPCGNRIAFSHSAQDLADTSGVYLYDLGSREIRLLVEIGADHLDFSPDGQRIAYSYMNFGTGGTDVYIIEIQERSIKRVTSYEGNDSYPHWSPDGEWIAFDSNKDAIRGSWPYSLWVIRPDGTARAEITRPPEYGYDEGEMRGPDWSPDGEYLVFTVSGELELFVMKPDGSGFRQLTDNKERRQKFRNPCWSPDGRRIAWQCNSLSGERQIWVINADGTQPVRVVRGGSLPSWSQDSRYLVYVGFGENEGLNIVKVENSGQ